ncbi:MAG: hypothetical protein PHN88_02405 [Ignavibacteria bacterium]|nr:hypothetical protein [Ignavibacteria bacterium]
MKQFSAFFILIAFISIFSKTAGAQQDVPHLYFCESYENGEEKNVSNTFTTGYLTAMLDLRPMGITIGESNVALEITMIADANGFYSTEQVLDVVKFTVDPSWDYIFFTDTENLKFTKPGVYRVMLMKEPNTQIASAIVKITAN